MYNVALIGCGHMGQAHLIDSAAKENIHIYAVCDIDRRRADETATRYHADKTYCNAEELIADPNVDIVIIATYPSTHLALLKACLAHKKHVLCEKPVAGNLEDGYAFMQAVKEHPECKVLVGHILRHNDTYVKVQELIAEGAIGKPIVMRLVHNHNTLGEWKKYHALIEETSPIIDCGVHYVDVMRWFTGEEVVNVEGTGVATVPGLSEGKYNYGIINVTLSGGSVGFYEVGWGNSMETEMSKEFIGPGGRIKITYQKDRPNHREDGNLITIYKHDENTMEYINVPFEEKPTGTQLEYLVDMIEKNVPANPSMEDVMKSFEVVCEADRKIRARMLG